MEISININEKKLTVKDLIGCDHEKIIWGRAAAFFAAYFLSNLLSMIFNMIARQFPTHADFWLPYIATSLIGTFLFIASILIVFRFVRHIYAAILVSTLAYSIVNATIRMVMIPQNSAVMRSIIFSLAWTFLLLLALHISVQKIKPTWLALIIAYFSAILLDQVVIILYYKIFEAQVIFSAKTEIIELVKGLFDAAIFGGLFWGGLQLNWSRWQETAIDHAETASPKGTESGASFEVFELKKVVDSRMIKKLLRPAAIGSIAFGILAVVLGAQTAHNNPVNNILMLLGVILILEGIWCAVAPQPIGLVVDGIVLTILGVWNIIITIYNASIGGSGSTGTFFIFGIWQIILGVKSIKQYKSYAYLANSPVSQESLQRLDLMTANINQLTEHVDESIIEFQVKTLFKKTPLKGKLIEDMILFVEPGQSIYMDKITNVQLKPTKKNVDKYPAPASLNINGMILQGEISQQSLDRFSRWQGQPLS